MANADPLVDTPLIPASVRIFLPFKRYDPAVEKRTSLILDPSQLADAARVLGTKGPTATVREALERVVRQERLDRLARWEFPEDALERLERMREPRKFDFD